jgi:hypothetical protein
MAKGKRLWFTSHTRVLVLFIVLLLVFGFIWRLETETATDLAHQKRVGNALEPFAVAAGALLSGAAAFNYLDDWLRKQKIREANSEDWRKRFPLDRLHKDFKVNQTDSAGGVLYIWDTKNEKRHWIVDPTALRWLGLSYADVETVSQANFSKIERGENIQA